MVGLNGLGALNLLQQAFEFTFTVFNLYLATFKILQAVAMDTLSITQPLIIEGAVVIILAI